MLNAAVFVDLALYLAVCGLASVELSCSLTTFSLNLAGSRSATLNLATALLSARGRASVCSGPCCESSSGSSVLLMARVGRPRFHLGHFLCRTREANSAAFLTVIARSLCNWASLSDSKGCFIILLVTGLIQILARSCCLLAKQFN